MSILSSAICVQVLRMTYFQFHNLLWMGGRQRSSPTRPAILKRTIMSFDEAIFQAVVGMLFQIFLSCANNPDRRQQRNLGCLAQTVPSTHRNRKSKAEGKCTENQGSCSMYISSVLQTGRVNRGALRRYHLPDEPSSASLLFRSGVWSCRLLSCLDTPEFCVKTR